MNSLDLRLNVIENRVNKFKSDAYEAATPSAAHVILTMVNFVCILIKALDKCREQRNSWSNYVKEFHLDELKEAENKDDEELVNILGG